MALTQECDSYKEGVCVLMCLFWGGAEFILAAILAVEGPYRCLYAYMTWMTMINGSGSALC